MPTTLLWALTFNDENDGEKVKVTRDCTITNYKIIVQAFYFNLLESKWLLNKTKKLHNQIFFSGCPLRVKVSNFPQWMAWPTWRQNIISEQVIAATTTKKKNLSQIKNKINMQNDESMLMNWVQICFCYCIELLEGQKMSLLILRHLHNE